MKDLAVFDLPCVFDSLDDCRKKLDDPDFYNLISQVYTDGGYHLLGMADQGFRIMSTNKPVYSLADFKGRKSVPWKTAIISHSGKQSAPIRRQ